MAMFAGSPISLTDIFMGSQVRCVLLAHDAHARAMRFRQGAPCKDVAARQPCAHPCQHAQGYGTGDDEGFTLWQKDCRLCRTWAVTPLLLSCQREHMSNHAQEQMVTVHGEFQTLSTCVMVVLQKKAGGQVRGAPPYT